MDEGRDGDGAEATFAPGQDVIPMPGRRPIGDWLVGACYVVVVLSALTLVVVVTQLAF